MQGKECIILPAYLETIVQNCLIVSLSTDNGSTGNSLIPTNAPFQWVHGCVTGYFLHCLNWLYYVIITVGDCKSHIIGLTYEYTNTWCEHETKHSSDSLVLHSQNLFSLHYYMASVLQMFVLNLVVFKLISLHITN